MIKPGDIIVEITTPFYGLLPFRLSNNWYWGAKIKTTYLVNTDLEKCPVRVQLLHPIGGIFSPLIKQPKITK